MTDTNTPAARVQAYLAWLSTSRNLDKEVISAFNMGGKDEAILSTADLRALLAEVEARRRPQADFDRRISELLEANNRYQQEARDARAALNTVLDTSGARGSYRVMAYMDAVDAAEKLLNPEVVKTEPAAPPPASPWPVGAEHNAKREGWLAFFTGRHRESCPFPPARADLQRDFRVGWDAAKAHHEQGAAA